MTEGNPFASPNPPPLPATPILDDIGLVSSCRAFALQLCPTTVGGVLNEAADRILALSADNARKDAAMREIGGLVSRALDKEDLGAVVALDAIDDICDQALKDIGSG